MFYSSFSQNFMMVTDRAVHCDLNTYWSNLKKCPCNRIKKVSLDVSQRSFYEKVAWPVTWLDLKHVRCQQ